MTRDPAGTPRHADPRGSQEADGGREIDLSVVAPARDECDNLAPLVREVERALAHHDLRFEFIVIDDGSSDGSREALEALLPKHPWLRAISLHGAGADAGLGQSAALGLGYRAARGRLIASLDADLQNDPADLPALIAHLEASGADLVQGDRSAARQDAAIRRLGSWVGRVFRRMLLGDATRDTGCSLRVMRREVALQLPLDFAGLHRFVPALAQQLGYRVVELPVRHRARTAGHTKYGFGLTRSVPGLMDLLAVRWMGRRRRTVSGDRLAP